MNAGVLQQIQQIPGGQAQKCKADRGFFFRDRVYCGGVIGIGALTWGSGSSNGALITVVTGAHLVGGCGEEQTVAENL